MWSMGLVLKKKCGTPETRLRQRFLKQFRPTYIGKKVKFSHTRYRALGPELIPVYRQSARNLSLPKARNIVIRHWRRVSYEATLLL